jgi:hypothetical protein
VTPADDQPIAASTLFTVSDAESDAITNYQFWDSTGAAASGKFFVNGVAQGFDVAINVSAAQLAQTTFQPGTSGTDELWVRASDGNSWSEWKQFFVSAPAAQNLVAEGSAEDGLLAQNTHHDSDGFGF